MLQPTNPMLVDATGTWFTGTELYTQSSNLLYDGQLNFLPFLSGRISITECFLHLHPIPPAGLHLHIFWIYGKVTTYLVNRVHSI